MSEDTAGDSGVSGVQNRAAFWQKRADDHKEKQLINPFSDWDGASHRQVLSQDDPRYGRPVEGSKTEFRGQKAGELVSSEILKLCEVIDQLGQMQDNGYRAVTFGKLFDAYTLISNKLVGMLMRARKQNLVTFEGEMLWQRRDEHVMIWLLQPYEAVLAAYRYGRDVQ